MIYPELTQEQKYAIDIYNIVMSLFDDDEDNPNFRYQLDEVDGTAFFTGFIMAFNMLFDQLTGNDSDLIDSVNTANRLVLQYLIKHGQEQN